MKWGNRQAREEAKWEQEEEDRGELEETLGQSYEGNIGKKKLQNLQDKAEKKKQREVEQQEREEFKKKREAFDVKERLQRENMLLNFINYIQEAKVMLGQLKLTKQINFR